MYSIFVTIRIKPGCAEEFTRASLGDAEGSVRDEPNCLRFDIHQDPEDPNCFYLYEVYTDPAALDAHREMPHFQKWWEAVQDMVDGPLERIDMQTVFPSDAGWKKQKPGLLKW